MQVTSMRMRLFALLPLAVALHATPLIVNNPGFEADPISTAGGFTCSGTTGFTGWNSLGGDCGTGLFRPTATHFTSGGAPEGVNTAYLNGTVGYWQTLSTSFMPGLFTFALEVGHRLDEPFGGYELQLLYGTTYNPANLLASTSSTTSPGNGQFGPASVSYFVNPGDPAIGQPIVIAFKGLGTQTNFDSVTVDGAVPEPATYALIGAGLILLAWRKRRD